MNTEIVNIENWKETETRISNLFCWNYVEQIHSSFLCENVSFVLIAQNTKEANDIEQFDFEYISQVMPLMQNKVHGLN